jgi:membrane protein YqaA with SNARE-associated domain
MAAVRPQVAVLVALVALVPVGVMTAFAGVTPLTGLALVNVVIIAGSLYYMFGASPGEGIEHAS